MFKNKFDHIRKEKLPRALRPLTAETPRHASFFKSWVVVYIFFSFLYPFQKTKTWGSRECFGMNQVGFLPNFFIGQFVNLGKCQACKRKNQSAILPTNHSGFRWHPTKTQLARCDLTAQDGGSHAGSVSPGKPAAWGPTCARASTPTGASPLRCQAVL